MITRCLKVHAHVFFSYCVVFKHIVASTELNMFFSCTANINVHLSRAHISILDHVTTNRLARSEYCLWSLYNLYTYVVL